MAAKSEQIRLRILMIGIFKDMGFVSSCCGPCAGFVQDYTTLLAKVTSSAPSITEDAPHGRLLQVCDKLSGNPTLLVFP